MPFASFGDAVYLPIVPFDWGRGQPQRQRKNGVDVYTGTILLVNTKEASGTRVSATDHFDALWALRVVVNVVPVGDGAQTVYIDSWYPPEAIQHTLSMSEPHDAFGNQLYGEGTEVHTAILSEMTMSERMWSGGPDPADPDPEHPTLPRIPTVVAIQAAVEFILLT